MALAKIHCPHCGASNVDVNPKDPCWKCTKKLNAPVVVQQVVEEEKHLGEQVTAVPARTHQDNRGPIPLILGVVIAIVAIALVYFLSTRH